MGHIHETLSNILLASLLHCCVCNASAQVERDSPEPISYQDIGRQYEIHGEFGKLYTEFTLKGIVKAPLPKGDHNGMVRIDVTHIRGKVLEKTRMNVTVHTKSTLPVGSEVELVVREEAKLSFPEGIDDVGSNPDTTHLGKLQCVVSLHERRVISQKPHGK